MIPPGPVSKHGVLCAGAGEAVQRPALAQALTLLNIHMRACECLQEHKLWVKSFQRDFSQLSCGDPLEANWEGLPAFTSDDSLESITSVSPEETTATAAVLGCLVSVVTLPQATLLSRCSPLPAGHKAVRLPYGSKTTLKTQLWWVSVRWLFFVVHFFWIQSAVTTNGSFLPLQPQPQTPVWDAQVDACRVSVLLTQASLLQTSS